ncbi:unnamed protein product [Ostreobium quekettii]|uniref:SnoaL-like domain-containing protein n=1 Tax=Ostreobium quekettii TaxID=121088 RepID=A0A8S1J5P4_9CHLO|nr:unnamed protein product [Ostreobium quekettii]|eukprot:evm.model.scf_558EXC.3 EVM.evm.TU.scf_558EXC.3   scf_558EXC:27700-28431(+)
MADDKSGALAEVTTTSASWVAAFCAGDVDTCASLYREDALMVAQPFGSFEGRKAIDEFWRKLVADGARDLKYANTKMEALDGGNVLLSADWTMNIGGGVITKEHWEKQADGKWLLKEDHFEVRDQASSE